MPLAFLYFNHYGCFPFWPATPSLPLTPFLLRYIRNIRARCYIRTYKIIKFPNFKFWRIFIIVIWLKIFLLSMNQISSEKFAIRGYEDRASLLDLWSFCHFIFLHLTTLLIHNFLGFLGHRQFPKVLFP